MPLLDQIYKDTFKIVYENLNNNRENLSKTDIIGFLDSLYENLGNSWNGKSEIQHTILSAEIAAHETFLVKYK